MNLRVLWQTARRWYASHSARDRRIIVAVLTAVGLSLLYVGVYEPMRDYRRRVAEEVAEGQEQLERAARFLAASGTLTAERDDLKKRFEQAKSRLLPGTSGPLGAAALQDRANALAAAKGITVQSTQVMREEPSDAFRKVTVRLTLSGELRPLAEFISGLEYGPQQVTLPFVEVSRRGATAASRGPRTIASTVEVSGYLIGDEQAKEGEGEAAEGEGAASAGEGEEQPPGGGGEGEGQPGEGEAPAGTPPPAAGLVPPSPGEAAPPAPAAPGAPALTAPPAVPATPPPPQPAPPAPGDG
jgi:hypothetical protein